MAQFTDRTVKALKATGKRYDVFDDAVRGLALRVGAHGSKSWTLFCRQRVSDGDGGDLAGPLKRITLGPYPELGLASARKKARLEVAQHRIPRPAGRSRRRTRHTFGDVAADYIKDWARTQKRSWKADEKTIASELLPVWKNIPMAALTRDDVKDVVDAIIQRGSPVRANRVLSLISKLCNWAIDEGKITANPAARIKKQPESGRDRELSADEVLALWTALDQCQVQTRATTPATADQPPGPAIAPMVALGLQVLLVTGQRPGEVFQMERHEIDLESGWWTIPDAKTKNKKTHRVPLTPKAIALIEKALTMKSRDGYVFAGVGGGSVADRAKKAASELTAAGAVPFTFHRHDLRRTAASGMARSGVSRDTIAKVLNHADGGSRATAIYDRYNYDAEKRTALATWERQLLAILKSKKTAGAVVPFSR